MTNDQGWSVLRAFFDDSGQDLIEYALLASIVAIAGVLVIPTIAAKMGTNFGAWGDAVYNLWAPSNPAPPAP